MNSAVIVFPGINRERNNMMALEAVKGKKADPAPSPGALPQAKTFKLPAPAGVFPPIKARANGQRDRQYDTKPRLGPSPATTAADQPEPAAGQEAPVLLESAPRAVGAVSVGDPVGTDDSHPDFGAGVGDDRERAFDGVGRFVVVDDRRRPRFERLEGRQLRRRFDHLEVERLVIHIDGLHVQPGSSLPEAPPAGPTAIRTRDLADSGTDVA